MEEKFLAGDTITTLVVRNIPPRFTLEHLLCQWPREIDFLYLPNSFESTRNLSFAFVNFTSAAAAEAFREQWHKKRLPGPRSRKALDIGAAEVLQLTASKRLLLAASILRSGFRRAGLRFLIKCSNISPEPIPFILEQKSGGVLAVYPGLVTETAF
jgi:mitochondrial fission protein ELM1